MENVLVLYPKEFKCRSKFDRKVANLVKNLNSPTFLFLNDGNHFVKKFAEEASFKFECENDWDQIFQKITHAIVFDDGEEFVSEFKELKKRNLPVRRIKIKITRVINIKKEDRYSAVKSTPDFEYIGRGSYWGNPYSMYDEGESREEVIRKFKYDFDFDKFPNKKKSDVYKLAGKRLGCFCKPEACHGDVIADFLNSWDDEIDLP